MMVVLVLRKCTQHKRDIQFFVYTAFFSLYRDAGNEVYIQATTNAAYELSKFQEETTYILTFKGHDSHSDVCSGVKEVHSTYIGYTAFVSLYRDAGNEVYIQATTNAAYELSKFHEEITK